MLYSSVIRAVYSSVWAILPEKLEAICAFLKLKADGGMVAPAVVDAIRAENAISAARMQSLSADKPGAVAVLPLYGIINQRYSGDMSGPSGTSLQSWTQQFRQAVNDPNIKAIVIDIDSPGGTVSGVDELATEIFNARKQKKISAVSNCLCASAAYWLACQASEVVVSPSSLTGSIGVYGAHEDDSEMLATMGVKVTLISAGKYKVEGNSFEPLSDQARAAMQGQVDDFYGMFTKAVARGRGVAIKAVQNGFGEGRVMTAQDAVKSGLADRVATLDEVLAKYGVKQASGGSSAQFESGIVSVHNPGGALPQAGGDDGLDDSASGAQCSCECEACMAGSCEECTHEDCDADAENCEGCPFAGEQGDSGKGATAMAAIEADARGRRLKLAQL